MNALQTGQDEAQIPADQDGGAPACVMSFNANDPSGASGIGADIATVAAMGGGEPEAPEDAPDEAPADDQDPA